MRSSKLNLQALKDENWGNLIPDSLPALKSHPLIFYVGYYVQANKPKMINTNHVTFYNINMYPILFQFVLFPF